MNKKQMMHLVSLFLFLVLVQAQNELIADFIQEPQEEQPDDYQQKKNFIHNLMGAYTVGSECITNQCPQTYLYAPANMYRCPKAGSQYGGIHWESKYQKYYLWFSTFIPFGWHGEFYAQVDPSHVFTNKYGNYELRIELELGFILHVVPCNVKSPIRKQHCNSSNKNHQLEVYKTFPEGEAIFPFCTFQMTKNL